ncbi:hypothetical protein D6C86_00814 [Aureobasidium pullulans]|uniref:Uncharacterized protein n=1 Tax=Aureobasidium pullulans TaxID=5580 RepID=A0A4S8XH75_AURPU|nr:hypothetical protein D6D22_06307 [Aureobasidium pullulans]THY77146.1 hypothetical protein D6C94_02409 [Aureobasidium pullulans]THZ47380.1 hypothetical protein D6C87_01413 [Aureobasidium pullulans]THZ66668.1 hypothetical protein D6C86_00814 [Aureobasidium pullulans]THZ80853.1 hypothetical protein D6C88_06421 [Aureobasidium pullulans]
MRPTAALRNLRSTKSSFQHPTAQSFLNSPTSPYTAKILARRVGWTVVWYSTAVTGVLGWPFIASLLAYGKIAV